MVHRHSRSIVEQQSNSTIKVRHSRKLWDCGINRLQRACSSNNSLPLQQHLSLEKPPKKNGIKYCGSNMDRDHLWVHWERCLCPDRVMHHVFGVKVPWKGGCGYWKSGEKEGKEVKVLETLEPLKGAQAGSVSSSSELSILPILTRNQSQPQPPTHLGKHHSCHLTPRSAILWMKMMAVMTVSLPSLVQIISAYCEYRSLSDDIWSWR